MTAGHGQTNLLGRSPTCYASHSPAFRRKKESNCREGGEKMPLLNVNAVLSEHFQTAPALFSIDTEGMDLAILQTLDFVRWRPKVFCVESGLDNGLVNENIVRLMVLALSSQKPFTSSSFAAPTSAPPSTPSPASV
jgi:hypothetical protein